MKGSMRFAASLCESLRFRYLCFVLGDDAVYDYPLNPMMKQLIACCGLDCESCEARAATLANDDELRAEIARKWSALNHAPEITAATINCTGCRADGVKFAYCSTMCAIRKCVHAKGFDTCGECADLDHCRTVGAVFEHAPCAKENLLS